MEIFLDQTYYMLNKLSKRAGAKVVVHDPKTAPLPDEYGLDLQPNTASSMAVQKTDITRLELPYVSNCTAGWNFTGYEGIPTGAKYSLAVRLYFNFNLIHRFNQPSLLPEVKIFD